MWKKRFDQETSPTLLVGYAKKAVTQAQSPLLATGASFIVWGADVPSTVTWIQMNTRSYQI